MAEVIEMTRRRCDRCGTQAEPAAKGSVPDGWLAGLGLHVPGTFTVLDDLCQGCAGQPVAQAVIPVEAA